jgi:isoprenylcysteine carboxyl methyltransferase (ICMT) family protein YpbQ
VTHEDFSRQEDIKASSDRSFGLVIATFFLIVALWPLIHAEPIRWWALGVAAVFVILALLWTAALAPLNKLWTKLVPLHSDFDQLNRKRCFAPILRRAA